ncbi:uracil-DNA glycosylase [Paenibacillus thalictri]|uniref:Uracil-DNA glycosylase n=1 Tax=Paenibacillus thalictri TaxID=2527873 RepID=A0A4V2J4A4_9BACL|nr:uracil-DNA glycosylase [Paenibacillus thalictri]TBL78218.1 uracil-DNA glycosylase [Paenibacillus thalictri]
MNQQKEAAARINCYRCKHFYVTWDSRFPRGCKAFGFKTGELPSAVVLKSSGQPCMNYVEKANGLKKDGR